MRAKRVLFVDFKHGRFGGLEIYNFETVKALITSGAEVKVISAHMSGQYERNRVVVHGLSPRLRLTRSFYFRTWRYWLHRCLMSLKGQFDLAIAGHFFVLPTVANWARQQGIPYWLNAFGIEVWRDWSQYEKRCVAESDRIIALSQYTAESMQQRAGRSLNQIDVIHPAVDTNLFRPSSKTNPERVEKVILTVGRIVAGRDKGHRLVISALPTIQESLGSELEYWIVGTGDDQGNLAEYAERMGVASSVKFKGAVWGNERIEFYRACDVFVMLSPVRQNDDGTWTGEGFGIVYIEAGACGKPVIACDEGGQTDAIIDGKTGLLIPFTRGAAADALIRILSDSKLIKQMGENARAHVVDHFDWTLFRSKWAGLLQRL